MEKAFATWFLCIPRGHQRAGNTVCIKNIILAGQACNPIYLGSRNQEDSSSKPAQEKC
jgi:hypothetical protein